MNKNVRVVLLDDADEAYKKLNFIVGEQISLGKQSSFEIQLLKSIKQKLEFIKTNSHYGDPIKKSLIPDEYVKKYGRINLFRVELTGFWRMLYMLRGSEVEVVAFVLDILNHENYDKKFGYRGR